MLCNSMQLCARHQRGVINATSEQSICKDVLTSQLGSPSAPP